MARVRCPICGREFDPHQTNAMPFCSQRCRLIDLGHWLDERYGLEREPDEDEDQPPAAP